MEEDEEGAGPLGSVTYLQERVRSLEQTVEELNADFSAKRAHFKDLFMKKEEELEGERREREGLGRELRALQDELNEAKSQVTIAQFTKENEIEMEKSKYQQDLTNLRLRFEEKLHHMRTKYEDELHQLRTINSRLESESSSEGSSILSAGFKTLTRKFGQGGSPSVSASNESLAHIQEEGGQATPTSGKGGQQGKQAKYAQEDAEMLRSLVVQMEEEVSVLKEKLRESDNQLAALQGAQASLVKGNDALTHLLEGDDVQSVLSQFDDKLRQARHGLEAEKSSRADLEMYVTFANAQKTVLQDELEKVRGQLRDTRCNYEQEKKRHEELKETWEKANEHFVSTQNDYIQLLNLYRQVLTPDQLETIKNKSTMIHAEDSASPIHEPRTDDSSSQDSICQECSKNTDLITKLRNDLLKAAQLRNEMEQDWSRISIDFQNKVSSLEEQIGTYDVVLLELNKFCQQSTEAMESKLKRLAYDRETTQRKIEKLENENEILKGKHVAHSHQLQNEYISLPNDVMELQEMVLRLKEELISVKVGKEQIEGEFKFLRDQMRMVEDEKSTMEESLNNEIDSIRAQLNDLTTTLNKSEEDRKRLDQKVADLKNRLLGSETQGNKLKSQKAELVKEKECLQSELQELQGKVSTLRRELTNSEELQKDLIALSKSLQVNLESIRQADTDVRWQHPEDIGHCNNCKVHLSNGKEKHHCKHCGRIFCSSCLDRTVRRGNRDYSVCGVCHTLLSHDSAPYFSTEPPHSPD